MVKFRTPSQFHIGRIIITPLYKDISVIILLKSAMMLLLLYDLAK